RRIRKAAESTEGEEISEADRNQIFEESDKSIFDVQRGDQFSPDFVTGERSDHRADRAENRADDQRLMSCRVHTRAAKPAHDNASRERDGRGSLRCSWLQIREQLEQSQEGKDDSGDDRSHERERRVAEIQPAKISGPRHDCRRRERAQTGGEANAQSKQQNGVHEEYLSGTHERRKIKLKPNGPSRTGIGGEIADEDACHHSLKAKTEGGNHMDMKLEVVVVPVSDVDQAKAFYEKLGWRLDIDYVRDVNHRVVQFTPPGSEASIHIGKG